MSETLLIVPTTTEHVDRISMTRAIQCSDTAISMTFDYVTSFVYGPTSTAYQFLESLCHDRHHHKCVLEFPYLEMLNHRLQENI